MRRNCKPGDPVFGAMGALIRHPFKLIWFERYPVALYDLDSDPEENVNLAPARPKLAAELTAEFRRLAVPGAEASDRATDTTVSPELIEGLEALGYLDDQE